MALRLVDLRRPSDSSLLRLAHLLAEIRTAGPGGLYDRVDLPEKCGRARALHERLALLFVGRRDVFLDRCEDDAPHFRGHLPVVDAARREAADIVVVVGEGEERGDREHEREHDRDQDNLADRRPLQAALPRQKRGEIGAKRPGRECEQREHRGGRDYCSDRADIVFGTFAHDVDHAA